MHRELSVKVVSWCQEPPYGLAESRAQVHRATLAAAANTTTTTTTIITTTLYVLINKYLVFTFLQFFLCEL